MTPIRVSISPEGYLQLPADLARQHFPQDLAAVLPKHRELWLLPTRGAAAGGLILKQRNPAGDRSVLIGHLLPASTRPGDRPAFWDDAQGALRVAL